MAHISAPDFKNRLLDWFKIHGRHDLPWQRNPSGYSVLVSEVMLQQTQVSTVIPYYLRWMERFPTLDALAQAPEDDVMACWQGLGYYSRARNLQKAALYITEHHQGQFPRTLEGLLEIPSIGRYTAGAVMSFAYNEYGPIVDGNVKRLFCRLFAIEGEPSQTHIQKQLWSLAETLTPTSDNRNFAQGLLDLGATLCTPKNPDCARCPFNADCQALVQNKVSKLPTRKPKKTLPERHQTFMWIQNHNQILLEKRPKLGIWGALWCLPEHTSSSETTHMQETQAIGTFRHTFSHFRLNASVVRSVQVKPSETQQWVSTQELNNVGLPAPIRRFIEKHLDKISY